MANKFYQPGDQRAAKVNDLFATIAPKYDLINDLQSFGMHRGWKKKLVQLAQVQRGHMALDVCCGTGDIAFLMSAAGAEVTGLDFSLPMLKVAHGRRAENTTPRGVPAPHFMQGDAERLPFGNSRFDVVTVGYGLRNLSNWELGLEEIWRVAKPGARLLVLDFGKPDDRLWRGLYFSYLRVFVPLFGKLFCGDSATHAYILESLKNYPAQHGVAKKMRDLGCRNVRIINLLGGVMTINYGERQ